MKTIPQFKTEDEERDFWDRADALDYFDTQNPIEMNTSRLKPSTTMISIRLTDVLLRNLKKLANKYDVPYQSLMKLMLEKEVRRGLGAK